MSFAEIIGACVAVLGVLGSYTLLVYKIGALTSTINANSALILEVRNIVINQDDRLDLIEKDIVKLKTTCNLNHKNKE